MYKLISFLSFALTLMGVMFFGIYTDTGRMAVAAIGSACILVGAFSLAFIYLTVDIQKIE
mgnify:CR=1 FL=1